MNAHKQILKVTSFICGILIIIGTALFMYGYFVNGYQNVAGVGAGAVMGAAFIFIMGVFLVATEEMIERNRQRKLS
ncbi:hypothetical protein CV093_08300 [Oceanobacillus sp. 143]|uniref:Uncharacterized protein n=1 Tax=Oceanobacillus zhaokaii TaxID=2052660 RepID=A0A345PFR2_9BACI|nr:hypothetical protein [Oceanobacillus zhaokaii]AXI08842.1 hypothetical protein CUC15_07910 [Oceanobacillus zhaokaii]QGS68532.1 hypothetical protein CV093_08300 [Oceanobacillus sp. 143]